VDKNTGKMKWHPGGVETEIRPDPQLVRDMREARDFTKRKADVFGHASFDSIWAKNSYGNQTLTEGEGLSKFFNFRTGTMKPGQIKDAAKLLDDVSTEWNRLARSGLYDHAEADLVRDDLVENTRDFITASLLHNVSHPSNTIEATGERALQFGKLRTAISRNRSMLQDSGMYTPAQLDMWDRTAKVASMIHSAQEKGTPIGSPTYSRMTGDSKFMDLFFGGPIRRMLMTGTAGSLIGGAASHVMGLGEWGGAMLGEAGGVALQAVMEKVYGASREEVLQLLDQAINNPQIAKDLMQTASKNAKFSDATRRWMHQIMAVTGAHVGADYVPQAAP
jgi:hypothetical protein